MYALLKRVYTAFAPPEAEKHGKPLRFGILSAATIALVEQSKDLAIY